jgi:hypothetical protein
VLESSFQDVVLGGDCADTFVDNRIIAIHWKNVSPFRDIDLGAAAPTQCVASRDHELNRRKGLLFHNIYNMVGSTTILVESRDTKLFHTKGLFFLNVDLGAAAPTHCVASRDRELNRRMGLLFHNIYNMVGSIMILVESHDTKLFHMKIPFLRNVDLGAAVPMFILSAADDPLFNPSMFPQEKSIKGGRRAPLKMVRTNHGGPLGYIFHQPEHAFGSRRAASWMPMELALFIRHVRYHPNSLTH